MSWLDNLSDSLSLLHDTINAGVADAESRAGAIDARGGR
jgi:hypothetical protein